MNLEQAQSLRDTSRLDHNQYIAKPWPHWPNHILRQHQL